MKKLYALILLLLIFCLPAGAQPSNAFQLNRAYQVTPLDGHGFGLTNSGGFQGTLTSSMTSSNAVVTNLTAQTEKITTSTITNLNVVNFNALTSGNAGVFTNIPAWQLVSQGNTNTAAHNFFIGPVGSAGNNIISGTDNYGYGYEALGFDMTGSANIAIGTGTMAANTIGKYNTAVGDSPMEYNTNGYYNSAYGVSALLFSLNGSYNTAIGGNALDTATAPTNVIAIGWNAGSAYTGLESSNIDIGNIGVSGESGVMRLGTFGIHTQTYIAGAINGNGTGLTNVNALTGSATNIFGTATNQVNGQIQSAALTNNAALTNQIYAALPGQLTNAQFAGPANFPANSDLAFSRYAITTLANGNNSDINTGTNVFVELSGNTGPVYLAGFAAHPNRDGAYRIILYRNSYPATIGNLSGIDATAANRIQTMTGSDRYSAGPFAATLVYSAAAGNWMLTQFESISSTTTNSAFSSLTIGNSLIFEIGGVPITFTMSGDGSGTFNEMVGDTTVATYSGINGLTAFYNSLDGDAGLVIETNQNIQLGNNPQFGPTTSGTENIDLDDSSLKLYDHSTANVAQGESSATLSGTTQSAFLAGSSSITSTNDNEMLFACGIGNVTGSGSEGSAFIGDSAGVTYYHLEDTFIGSTYGTTITNANGCIYFGNVYGPMLNAGYGSQVFDVQNVRFQGFRQSLIFNAENWNGTNFGNDTGQNTGMMVTGDGGGFDLSGLTDQERFGSILGIANDGISNEMYVAGDVHVEGTNGAGGNIYLSGAIGEAATGNLDIGLTNGLVTIPKLLSTSIEVTNAASSLSVWSNALVWQTNATTHIPSAATLGAGHVWLGQSNDFTFWEVVTLDGVHALTNQVGAGGSQTAQFLAASNMVVSATNSLSVANLSAGPLPSGVAMPTQVDTNNDVNVRTFATNLVVSGGGQTLTIVPTNGVVNLMLTAGNTNQPSAANLSLSTNVVSFYGGIQFSNEMGGGTVVRQNGNIEFYIGGAAGVGQINFYGASANLDMQTLNNGVKILGTAFFNNNTANQITSLQCSNVVSTATNAFAAMTSVGWTNTYPGDAQIFDFTCTSAFLTNRNSGQAVSLGNLTSPTTFTIQTNMAIVGTGCAAAAIWGL